MLTYTSLLVVCLVVSAIAFFLYKVVADSSRSVYKSKIPIILGDAAQDHHKDPVNAAVVANKSKAFGENRGHTTPADFAKTYPAMPTESVNWGWQGSGVQLHEPQFHSGHAAGNSRHCSLYDVKSPKPDLRPNLPTGRLHREEKVKPVGRSYKVTRRAESFTRGDGSLNKPWGW